MIRYRSIDDGNSKKNKCDGDEIESVPWPETGNLVLVKE